MTQNAINTKNPLVQYVYNVNTTATVVNAAIPKDGTIPQNTEGVEVMTCSITPTVSTNLLVINANVWGLSSGAADIVMALFQDSTANALAAMEGAFVNAATKEDVGELSYVMVAGTTSSTTFKIRCGINTGKTVTINAALFGGVQTSFMEIMEIKP